MTEYEYEYYSASLKWLNTNKSTTIIQLPKNDQLEYKYYLFPKNGQNMITKIQEAFVRQWKKEIET